MSKKPGRLDRRQFVKTMASAGTLLAAPHVIPSTALGKDGAVSPSERITLGGIGSVMGITFAVLALIADQIGRGRKIQEELLYHERRRYFTQRWERQLSEMTGDSTSELPATHR